MASYPRAWSRSLGAHRLLVLGNDVGGDTAAVLGADALFPGPGADRHGIDRAGPAVAADSAPASRATGLAGMSRIVCERVAQVFGVLGVEVDLVVRAVRRVVARTRSRSGRRAAASPTRRPGWPPVPGPRPPSASATAGRSRGTPGPPQSTTSTRTGPSHAFTATGTLSPGKPEPLCSTLLPHSSLASNTATSPHG